MDPIKITKEEVKQFLNQGVCEVTFTKKDGKERIMLCTTAQIMIPPEHRPDPVPDTSRKVNEDVQAVFDLENDGWRSFRWDSVQIVDERIFTD